MSNFSIKEFASNDGAYFPVDVVVQLEYLIINLQELRNYVGKPITINSGYRSPNHNKRVGGAKNSQHVKGNAADIVIKGYTPKEVSEIIEKLIKSGRMSQGGLGTYDTFTHYDIRGTKARWNG